MKRLAMIALIAGIAPATRADMVETGRFGEWASYAGTVVNGKQACSISTMSDDAERYFGIKMFAGDMHLTMHIGKATWSIPPGSPVPVRVSIDARVSWMANAKGGDRMAEFYLELPMVAGFFEAFRAGATMQLHFLAGNEPTWPISLSGSSWAATALARCIRNLGTPSQPFGEPPPPSERPAVKRRVQWRVP